MNCCICSEEPTRPVSARTGVPSDRYGRNNSQESSAHFDPAKYADQGPTPNTSAGGWSVSLSTHSNDPRSLVSPSTHSNDPRSLVSPAHHAINDTSKPSINAGMTDISGQESSIVSKKGHMYDTDPPSSWHERYHNMNDDILDHKASKKMLNRFGRSHSMEDILDQDTRSEISAEVQHCFNDNNNVVTHSGASATSATNTVTKSSASTAKSIRDTISPLNSARLRQIRQRTRNAVVSCTS